jgi:hypothetical protein
LQDDFVSRQDGFVSRQNGFVSRQNGAVNWEYSAENLRRVNFYYSGGNDEQVSKNERRGI